MSMTSAEQEGLRFQGGTADEWRDDEVMRLKQRAKEIRKLGFRAKAVKSNKSEWGCGSYVLMVEPRYFDYENAMANLWRVQDEQYLIEKAQERANMEIETIKQEAAKYRKLCDELGIKY